MIDYPYPASFIAPLPANPVSVACSGILGAAPPLPRLLAAVDLYVNGTGGLGCYDLDAELVGGQGAAGRPLRPKPDVGEDLGVTSWNYQACTELPLEPITSDGYGFYPPDGSQLPSLFERCGEVFGVTPRPSWLSDSFGTSPADNRYLNNTIISENGKDPWRVGTAGIEGNKRNGLHVLLAAGGAHHQDLRFEDDRDGEGVKEARRAEKDIIKGWLKL